MKIMENIEKYIKEQLEEYEMTPPAGFWHQISDALDKQESSENKSTSLPQKKSWLSRGQFLRIAASLIFLIGIGGIIRFLQINNNHEQTTTVVVSADNSVNTAPSKSALVESTAPNPVKVIQSQKTVAKSRKPKAVTTLPVASHQVVEKNEQEELTVQEIIPEKTIVAQKGEVTQSVISNSTDVPTNSIPVYSLKLLDKNVPENDEITVIENDPKKVIVIEKGLSRKPEITYQLPLRF